MFKFNALEPANWGTVSVRQTVGVRSGTLLSKSCSLGRTLRRPRFMHLPGHHRRFMNSMTYVTPRWSAACKHYRQSEEKAYPANRQRPFATVAAHGPGRLPRAQHLDRSAVLPLGSFLRDRGAVTASIPAGRDRRLASDCCTNEPQS